MMRPHLFDRYSIVFPFVSVSQREKGGKHIGKRYDKERRYIEPRKHTEERWGQIRDNIGTLRKVGVILHRIKSKFRAKRQKAKQEVRTKIVYRSSWLLVLAAILAEGFDGHTVDGVFLFHDAVVVAASEQVVGKQGFYLQV